MTDPDHTPDPSNDPSADERIDALARAAGSQLRRPAPADGIARVQRAKRRRQTAQLGGAGVAAVAILAVGAFTIGGDDAGPTVVPATVSTVDTPDTTTPETTMPATTVPDTAPGTTDAPPPTSEPPDTPGNVPPNAAGAPSVVYTSADFASFGGQVSTVDPTTGAVTSTFTVDQAASDAAQAAQDALDGSAGLAATRITGGTEGTAIDGQGADAGWFTYEYVVDGVTFAFDVRPSEYQYLQNFSAETLARFDACDQSELRVTGLTGDALPDRISSLVISADTRWMIVRHVECPAAGPLTVDGATSGQPWIFELFDLERPDQPGRVLVDGGDPYGLGNATFSADGEFAAIENDGIRFFSTTTADEIPLVDDGCTAVGTKWSRFIGPWIDESSVALQVTCVDRASLVVHDLTSDERFEVPVTLAGDTSSFTADVDFAHYDRPSNIWYTVCTFDYGQDGVAATGCVLGNGSAPTTLLPGALEASFLPLGFTPGG